MSYHKKNDEHNGEKVRSLPPVPNQDQKKDRPLPTPPKKTLARSLSKNFVGKSSRSSINPNVTKSATTDSIPDKNKNSNSVHSPKKLNLYIPKKSFAKKSTPNNPTPSNNHQIHVTIKKAPKKSTNMSRHNSVGRYNRKNHEFQFKQDNLPVHHVESLEKNDTTLNISKSNQEYIKSKEIPTFVMNHDKKKKRLSLDMSKSKSRGTLIVSTSFVNELNNIVKSPLMMNSYNQDLLPAPPPPPPLPPTTKSTYFCKKAKKEANDPLDLTKKKKKRGFKAYVRMNLEFYKEMIDLLILNGFMIIRYVDPNIKRKELDRVSKSFLSILSYKEVVLDYIKTMIRMELEASTQEGTLFRTNNICTGIMSSYSMKVGRTYLNKVLGPCFEWLMESKLDFEIDSNQVENPEDVRKNTFNLNYLANKFFKSILNSVDIIPFEIREISNTLQQAVIKKFPNSLYTAVGGFFFLRFVVPAVINPEGLDVLKGRELDPRFKRPLTLVAKTLQQIANNQKFNEPHMEPLNDMIRKWTIDVHKFFNSLVQKDNVALEKERERIVEKMKVQERHDDEIDHHSFATVHRILVEHIDMLALKISEDKSLGYDPVVELKELFEKMGELPDEDKKKKSLHRRATAFLGKMHLKMDDTKETSSTTK